MLLCESVIESCSIVFEVIGVEGKRRLARYIRHNVSAQRLLPLYLVPLAPLLIPLTSCIYCMSACVYWSYKHCTFTANSISVHHTTSPV